MLELGFVGGLRGCVLRARSFASRSTPGAHYQSNSICEFLDWTPCYAKEGGHHATG
jgi:hypothetical protein